MEDRPEFANQDKCSICEIAFGYVTPRKHHCRCCGASLCYDCSDYWSSIPRLGYADAVERMCFACYCREHDVVAGKESLTLLPESGESQGTIVMVNEAVSVASFQKKTAQALAQRTGHRVVVVEYPGCGARAQEELTVESALQAVSEVIDSLEGRVILFGYSYGGFVALRYAEQAPEKVQAVVLSGCCWRGEGAHVMWPVFGYQNTLNRTALWFSLAKYFAIGQPVADVSVEEFAEWKQHGFFFRAWPGFAALTMPPRANYYRDVLKGLKEAHTPVCIINGERDGQQTLTDEYVEASGATLHKIPDAGHEVLARKHLETVLDHIKEFLK